jgi:hypothetical protein
MATQTRADAVAETLRRIEITERRSRAAFVGAFALEGAYRDRTHVLLLLTAAAMLTLGALWGVALVGVVNRHTLRVLRAVELLRAE